MPHLRQILLTLKSPPQKIFIGQVSLPKRNIYQMPHSYTLNWESDVMPVQHEHTVLMEDRMLNAARRN